MKASQLSILTALFSPAFPTGAFAYSHGMECAIQQGVVSDASSAGEWIDGCLRFGSGRNDAILMALAWQKREVNDLAIALSAGAERARETIELGANFTRAVNAVYGISLPEGLAYPIAAGHATRELGCGLEESLLVFLQAFVTNLVSVAIRAVPLGQSDGQAIIRNLMASIATLATQCSKAGEDNLGGCAFLSDMQSLQHEAIETRIYRT